MRRKTRDHGQKGTTGRIHMPRGYAGLGPSRARTGFVRLEVEIAEMILKKGGRCTGLPVLDTASTLFTVIVDVLMCWSCVGCSA